MPRSARKPDPDAEKFKDFIRSGIYELKQIAAEEAGDYGGGSQLPAVPRAAQLSIFLLLVTRGIDRKHRTLYAHKEELQAALGTVYEHAKQSWLRALAAKSPKARAARLQDTSDFSPYVDALTRFADKRFGMSSVPLSTFGVTDVQVALGMLVKKVSAEAQQALGITAGGKARTAISKSSRSRSVSRDIPNPVLGAVLVATVGADVGIQGAVKPDQAKAIRVGVGIGTGAIDRAKPEKPAVKQLRRTLEELGEYVGDQKS
jgi:hypothetical protein